MHRVGVAHFIRSPEGASIVRLDLQLNAAQDFDQVNVGHYPRDMPLQSKLVTRSREALCKFPSVNLSLRNQHDISPRDSFVRWEFSRIIIQPVGQIRKSSVQTRSWTCHKSWPFPKKVCVNYTMIALGPVSSAMCAARGAQFGSTSPEYVLTRSTRGVCGQHASWFDYRIRKVTEDVRRHRQAVYSLELELISYT